MEAVTGVSIPSDLLVGRGMRFPGRLGCLGERRKLPRRGLGQSPGRKRVLVHLELERTHNYDVDKFDIFCHFLRHIFSHIHNHYINICTSCRLYICPCYTVKLKSVVTNFCTPLWRAPFPTGYAYGAVRTSAPSYDTKAAGV